MPAPADKEPSPPYLSFTTLMNFVKSMREAVLPNRIDRTLLVGQAGGTQTYILSALRFLGFTEADGTPTQRFSRWNANPGDESEIFAEAIKESYPFFFNGECNITAATEGEAIEMFGKHNLRGSTARKALTFFVSACEFGKIDISPHLKSGRPTGAGANNGGNKRPKKRKPSPGVSPKGSEGGFEPADHRPLTPGMNVATLPLNHDGSRFVRLESPRSISTAELNRIQQWLSFQLIVTDNTEIDDD